jgi:hypothetical protein
MKQRVKEAENKHTVCLMQVCHRVIERSHQDLMSIVPPNNTKKYLRMKRMIVNSMSGEW